MYIGQPSQNYLNYLKHYILVPRNQQFSTCGPQTTSGPWPSAWWLASKA